MSLLRPIIRTCAVAALRDKTWAGTKVYDSNITPLADAIEGQAETPYVVVFTDTDDRINTTGAEMYRGDQRNISLTIEMGIASAVTDSKGGKTIHIANTDEGHELAVDVLDAQVRAVLWGDPYSEWGDLLRRIMYHVRRVPSRRGGQAAGGIRFAARRTVFIADTIDDIVPGVPLAEKSPISDFITMAQTHPDAGIAEVGEIIQELVATSPNPPWRIAQARMGMSERSIKALQVPGIPLPDPRQEQPPLDWSDPSEWAPVLQDIQLSTIVPPGPPYPAPTPPDEQPQGESPGESTDGN